jgi:hypothetical protein
VSLVMSASVEKALAVQMEEGAGPLLENNWHIFLLAHAIDASVARAIHELNGKGAGVEEGREVRREE